MLMVAAFAGPASAAPSTSYEDPKVLVQGAAIVAGTNGLFFDADNHLYAAAALGRGISILDPETGDIVDSLGEADGVVFPDDVTIGEDGTLYWTDIALGTVFRRPPGGPSEPLFAPGTYPSANPLTLSDDGKRLFFAQCYNGPTNGIFEVTLATLAVRTIGGNVADCASNAMDYANEPTTYGIASSAEALYSPRPFEDRVVRVDIATGATTDVTTGWGAPIAVKFGSDGSLYAGNDGSFADPTGQVVRIDLDNPDKANNREVLATFPFGWIDNIALDKDDRIFVSSYTDGTIVEILDDGSLRTVSPGEMSLPMGVAVLDGTLYTSGFASVNGWNLETGAAVSTARAVFGIGPLAAPTGIAVWDDKLVLPSSITGLVMVWDPTTGTPGTVTNFTAPADAISFQGELIVSDIGTGTVVRATGADLATREVLATTALPTGLAATDDDLYVADGALGVVLQVVKDGVLLGTPETIASGFTLPEGIAIAAGGNGLLVVDGGAGTLVEVNLVSGKKTTIASGFGFFTPLPPVAPFGWFNNVAVSNGDIFVNADLDNVVYKISAEAVAGSTGLVDPATGKWHLYDSAGALTTSFYYGDPGDIPFMGDWNCSGVETPGLYRPSDGYAYLRNSNTQGIADIEFFFGDPGDMPIAGDFNGDGCDTVSVYRASNQTFYIINKLGTAGGGLGAAEVSYVFGDPGDKPFVGDFDSDGVETVGLHRESTGLVYYRNSHTQGNADAQFIYGNPGDRMVAGDWNDDGMYSPALYRPSDITMYFRFTNTQGNADYQFVPAPNGEAWLPVAGQR